MGVIEEKTIADRKPALPGTERSGLSGDAQDCQLTLVAMQSQIEELHRKVTTLWNDIARARNRLQLSGTVDSLCPLRDPRTGLLIPSCPESMQEVRTMRAADATRFLGIMSAAIPTNIGDKRAAVRAEFLGR